MKTSIIIIILFFIFSSCSVSKQLDNSAKKNILDDPSLKAAHVGISVYEPATGKYLYNYQGDKYFVPASNTKIATCYAAMKYLGDSLVGLRYGIPDDGQNLVIIKPAADPTFLHADFSSQPAFDFLRQKFSVEKLQPVFYVDTNEVERWGSGWSWNDYDQDYMVERSAMPVFGNVIKIKLKDSSEYVSRPDAGLFSTGAKYFDALVNNSFSSSKPGQYQKPFVGFSRLIAENSFSVARARSQFSSVTIPFVTDRSATAFKLIEDSLGIQHSLSAAPMRDGIRYQLVCKDCDNNISPTKVSKWNVIHSQPTDSLLIPMMHRSDNFFAEQSLLMVSNERLGIMSDAKIIDTVLKTDFKDLPQQPRWVDGSGLSRYNLFTPQDFVNILNMMRNEFGIERVRQILPTGNEGTLSNYYNSEAGFIFGKTGTLSGVVALSGFLYTKKNKLLIFSILVNNHRASATDVRRAVERFVKELRKDY